MCARSLEDDVMGDRHLLTLVAVVAASAACADGSGALAPPERAGGTIEIGVAAMHVAGVAEAEWSIRVESCVLDDGACTRVPDETVFEVVVTSTRFGDRRGSAIYVGPCDATTLENLVSIRLVQPEDEDGAELDFEDPGTLSLWVDCDANRDTLVRFGRGRPPAGPTGLP